MRVAVVLQSDLYNAQEKKHLVHLVLTTIKGLYHVSLLQGKHKNCLTNQLPVATVTKGKVALLSVEKLPCP